MSRVFIQPGDVMTFTAPGGGVTAGVGLLIGGLFVIPQETVRVSKETLGSWARQLKAWGFTDVDAKYTAMK